MCKEIDIDDQVPEIDIDDPGLAQAIDDMKPGDQLIVQGRGGPMTVGVPGGDYGTDEDVEREMREFSKTYDPLTYKRDESWFD